MFTVHLYEWQIQGGKAVLQASTSKTTGRVERRGTQMGNPPSPQSWMLINEAGTVLSIFCVLFHLILT